LPQAKNVVATAKLKRIVIFFIFLKIIILDFSLFFYEKEKKKVSK
jgi:hypothetical protein